MPNTFTSSYPHEDEISELNEYAEKDFVIEKPDPALKVVGLRQPRIFEGWKNVPDDLKTREDWQLLFRTVKQKETPAARVRTFRKRRLQSVHHEFEVERFNNLFDISQTREVRKTSLMVARHDFYECFATHSNWQRQIRWTQGGYVYPQDKDRYWDETIEEWGWRTYKRKVSLSNLTDHQLGRELFGVFGAKISYFLLIDLDLHNQPLELFLRRLELLLNHFHGRHGCHFQVANNDARGVHLILFFSTPGLLSTRHKWLLRELSEIDEADPSGQFTKSENSVLQFNIEVYPNTSHAVRLPLARDRKMLLDKPLELVSRRGKQSQDVVRYMDWLRQDPAKRTFMSKDEVNKYIMERLDFSCAGSETEKSEEQTQKSELEPEKLSGLTIEVPDSKTSKPAKKISLKGKARQSIVSFWLKGEKHHFQHLNSAIRTTLGAIHAEGVTENDAVEILMRYVADIPNKDVSSRLSGDLRLVGRDIARQAKDIWLTPVNKKWQRSVECWSSYGFKVSDKTTWSAKPSPAREEVVVDCEEVAFSDSERDLIVKTIAPLLVGKKQANKKDKQDEVERAVAYFLRYVRCCDREIPYKSVDVILSNFNINFGRDHKKSLFLKLLIEMKWIYVRTPYFCPTIHGGDSGTGRATAYGIGQKMAGKFNLPLPLSNNKQCDLLLSSTFFKDRLVDDEIQTVVAVESR